MMCADLLHLEEEIRLFEEEGVDYLHVDIMDGHYVPNFTLGLDFCMALNNSTRVPLDIHLMIENPDHFIPIFSQFPDSVLTFHPETVYHPIRTLELIKDHGARAGIAIAPATPLAAVECLLPHCDLVCLMMVSPGYAGQEMVPQSLPKIGVFKEYIRERGFKIEMEVDGNVSWDNIPHMKEAGAEVFVVGTSSLFAKNTSRRDNLRRIRLLLSDSSDQAR
jgi:ribulose-phosphate 3-epimerase